MIFLNPLPGGAWISSTDLPGLNSAGRMDVLTDDRLETTAIGDGQPIDPGIRFYYGTVEDVDVIRL